MGAGGAMETDMNSYCPARRWGWRRRSIDLTKWLFETVFMATLRTDSFSVHLAQPTAEQ
jgi:hypothetical protein